MGLTPKPVIPVGSDEDRSQESGREGGGQSDCRGPKGELGENEYRRRKMKMTPRFPH